MKRLATAGLLVISANMGMAHTKIYQWQDANGATVFSDQPRAGAREIVVKPPATTSFSSAASPPDSASGSKPPTVDYRLTIVVPGEQATLRNNEGVVTVIATTEPTPGRSLQYRLSLDGKQVGQPSPAAHFQLENLARGEHRVQIQLTDDSGKIIAYSQSVTFFLHRASVLNRPKTGGL